MDTDLLYRNGTFSLVWVAGSGLLSQRIKRQKCRPELLNCDLEEMCKTLKKFIPDPEGEDGQTPSGRSLGLKKVAILMDGFTFILHYQYFALRDDIYDLLNTYKKKRTYTLDSLDFGTDLEGFEQMIQKKDKRGSKRTVSIKDSVPEIVDLTTGVKLPRISEDFEVAFSDAPEESPSPVSVAAVPGISVANTMRDADLPEINVHSTQGFYEGGEAPQADMEELIGVFHDALNQPELSPRPTDGTEHPEPQPEQQEEALPLQSLNERTPAPIRRFPEPRAERSPSTTETESVVASPRRSRTNKRLKFQDNRLTMTIRSHGTSEYVNNGYQLTDEEREILAATGRAFHANPNDAKFFTGVKAIECAGRKIPGKDLGKFALDRQTRPLIERGRRARSSEPPQPASASPLRAQGSTAQENEEEARGPTSSRLGDNLPSMAHGSGVEQSTVTGVTEEPTRLPPSPNPLQGNFGIGDTGEFPGYADAFGMQNEPATGPEPQEEGPKLFQDLAPPGITSKQEAARLFFELLDRQAKKEVLLIQDVPLGPIQVHYLK